MKSVFEFFNDVDRSMIGGGVKGVGNILNWVTNTDTNRKLLGVGVGLLLARKAKDIYDKRQEAKNTSIDNNSSDLNSNLPPKQKTYEFEKILKKNRITENEYLNLPTVTPTLPQHTLSRRFVSAFSSFLKRKPNSYNPNVENKHLETVRKIYGRNVDNDQAETGYSKTIGKLSS